MTCIKMPSLKNRRRACRFLSAIIYHLASSSSTSTASVTKIRLDTEGDTILVSLFALCGGTKKAKTAQTPHKNKQEMEKPSVAALHSSMSG